MTYTFLKIAEAEKGGVAPSFSTNQSFRPCKEKNSPDQTVQTYSPIDSLAGFWAGCCMLICSLGDALTVCQVELCLPV